MSLYTVPELIQRLEGMDFDDAQLADGQVVYEAAQALKQLSGNLSLAEEGLANYAQEVERMKAHMRNVAGWLNNGCEPAKGAAELLLIAGLPPQSKVVADIGCIEYYYFHGRRTTAGASQIRGSEMIMTTSYRIALNASQDLYEAGYPNDEVQIAAFEAAYRKAAGEYAQEHGIEIEVVCGSDVETADCDNAGHGNDSQADKIWQAIHDRVSWTQDDAEPITNEDEDGIREWLNVMTASVDSDGDVWVEGPCAGHWLSEERKAEYLAWRSGQS